MLFKLCQKPQPTTILCFEPDEVIVWADFKAEPNQAMYTLISSLYKFTGEKKAGAETPAFESVGGYGWIRTTDPIIMSDVL